MMAEFRDFESGQQVVPQPVPGNAWNETGERVLETVEPHSLNDERTATNAAASAFASRETLPQADTVAGEALLFSNSEVETWRSRWTNVQADFVDQPRQSVEQAEELVSTVLQRLAQNFTSERDSLEQHWSKGESVSTEDLRVALQRYRAFFGKLLNVA